jgi:hypothetical protein
MIVQSEIQPFTKEGSELKTNEMHFYELPWPKEVLQELPLDTKVKMKITLSYFIEPGPGEIGWKDRYRYPSHGLRFEVNAPDEDKENFVKRINQADREHKNDTSDSSGTADFWKYGKQVDPFKQKLPSAEPLKENIKPRYLKFIEPLKYQLDNELPSAEKPHAIEKN